MRFFFLVTLASLGLLGCSSDEEKTNTGPQVNACVSRGYECIGNFPLKCIGQFEDVSDPSLATACGKTSDGVQIPCCQRVVEAPDTGAADTGMADAPSDGSEMDAPADDAGDAATDETSTDAADAG